VGDWLVEPSLNQISRNGQTVKIEPRKMEMLLALASRPGELVTTEKLLDTVWRGMVVTQSSIYQNIAQLRRLLGDVSDQPTYIETISRKGYRLIAPVADATADADRRSTAPAALDIEGSPRRRVGDHSFWRRRSVRWTAVAVIALLGALLWLLPGSWFARWVRGSGEPVSIAVLPFSDLSDSQTDQLYCDGLAEAVLNSLARVPGLRVAARTSSFSNRDRKLAPTEFANQLNVSHILEGSVRRSQKTIRIEVHLTDATSGRHVWSTTYDRPPAETAKIQSQITQGVIGALHIPLGSQGQHLLALDAGVNIDAYDLYLLGMANVAARTPEKISKARDYFRTATDFDPKFALAYVGLARSYIQAYYYADLPLRDAAAQAQPLLDRALTLDQLSAEAYATQGLLRSELLELPEAELDLRRAIALNPNYSDAYLWLGLAAAQDGRPLDALREYHKALELDPLNFIILARMGLESGSAGLFDDGERFYARAAQLAPRHPNVPWGNAFNEMLRGRLDKSISFYRRALELDAKRRAFWIQLGWVLLDVGRLPQATEAFETAAALAAPDPDAQLEQAYVAIAGGDLPKLAAYLDEHQLDQIESIESLLDAGFLEFLAGRTGVARRLYAKALPVALTRPTVVADPWDIRWGRSDLIDAAAFYVASGERAKATPLIEQVTHGIDRLEQNGNVWAGLSYTRARMLALQGQTDAALAALEKAYERGWRRSWWPRIDPSLRPLAGNARFQSLMEKIDQDIARMNRAGQ
jgi:TolB-like protein/DNA-binding winged helix-turn-helix (wHTH) protein/Tfp pilus assembly protein PilF